MNKYILLANFLFVSASSFAQTFKSDSVKAFVNKTIDLIKENAINQENIDEIKRNLYDKSSQLNSIDEVVPLYKEVFKQLNDHHGGLKYKGKTYGWSKPAALSNAYLKERLKEDKVVSEVINENIGYIRIPGNNDFAFKKVDSLANDIVSHINSIQANKIKGWIIDLRLNTGGNMYPILLGLKEFIGDNIVFGGFRNAQNKPTGSWEIKNGKMVIDGTELERKSALKYPVKNNMPVIILSGCYTASAGEMTAISFIGRAKTYIVGEPTANYTTAVQGFKVNETAGINLATDYVVDRNFKVYKANITPDVEIIGGDNLEDLKKDLKIKKALMLIKK